jgi:hypothetical protein
VDKVRAKASPRAICIFRALFSPFWKSLFYSTAWYWVGNCE